MHLRDEVVAVFILPLHQWLRAVPEGVNSLAFLVWFTGGHKGFRGPEKVLRQRTWELVFRGKLWTQKW